MSRVAKAAIKLPANVELTINRESVTVKGPKGTLTQHYNKVVNISNDNGTITFKPDNNDNNAWSHAGTARSLVNNMLTGVSQGFSITLELVGVGFRAQTNGKSLALSLGFSHGIDYKLPEGIAAQVPNNTTIVLSGINKQLVGQVAAEIRSFRPPEPYKGKGIKYAGEVIIRKETKKK